MTTIVTPGVYITQAAVPIVLITIRLANSTEFGDIKYPASKFYEF